MIASTKTIQLLHVAAAQDDVYQLLRQQIQRGWPERAADVPIELREYYTFADELTNSGNFVYKGSCIVVPFGAREELSIGYTAVTLASTAAFDARATPSTGQEWRTKSAHVLSAATSASNIRQHPHVNHSNRTTYQAVRGRKLAWTFFRFAITTIWLLWTISIIFFRSWPFAQQTC